jgi:hypothetical protein
MYLSEEQITWPETTIALGLLVAILFVMGIALATWMEYRKLRVSEKQSEGLQQLVHRYEKLAENTMDTQQRIAADVADLRTRAAAIEQILRTVE